MHSSNLCAPESSHASANTFQVGRVVELKALIADIDRVADGSSTFRLVIGEYGAGKTFFLNLVRSIALEKKLVTMHADLNPDRRLQASGGQARSLFAELTRNTGTRTKPEGGGLTGVLERFVAQAQEEAGLLSLSTEQVVRRQTAQLAKNHHRLCANFALINLYLHRKRLAVLGA